MINPLLVGVAGLGAVLLAQRARTTTPGAGTGATGSQAGPVGPVGPVDASGRAVGPVGPLGPSGPYAPQGTPSASPTADPYNPSGVSSTGGGRPAMAGPTALDPLSGTATETSNAGGLYMPTWGRDVGRARPATDGVTSVTVRSVTGSTLHATYVGSVNATRSSFWRVAPVESNGGIGAPIATVAMPWDRWPDDASGRNVTGFPETALDRYAASVPANTFLRTTGEYALPWGVLDLADRTRAQIGEMTKAGEDAISRAYTGFTQDELGAYGRQFYGWAGEQLGKLGSLFGGGR